MNEKESCLICHFLVQLKHRLSSERVVNCPDLIGAAQGQALHAGVETLSERLQKSHMSGRQY